MLSLSFISSFILALFFLISGLIIQKGKYYEIFHWYRKLDISEKKQIDFSQIEKIWIAGTYIIAAISFILGLFSLFINIPFHCLVLFYEIIIFAFFILFIIKLETTVIFLKEEIVTFIGSMPIFLIIMFFSLR